MKISELLPKYIINDYEVVNMEFTYILPGDAAGTLRKTKQNSIIIIGANGSGKSRLGAWLEEKNLANYHRISGQRVLNFTSNIPLRSEHSAMNHLWYGRENGDSKLGRWNYERGHYNYTTTELRDADDALALVFAKKASQDREYVRLCKDAEFQGVEKPRTQEDVIEKLIRIWNNVFPHRQIILEDNQINVVMPNGNTRYSGIEMSDGEKACLYLMAQCLAIPENKNIIIDEPELHLHRSIMNKLWSELEKARPDCLFIYITHDTNFAANHRNSDKIWVKNFDGTNWKLEYIKDSELPQQLLLDILGNRKKVLFVEGNPNSWDTELYSEFYPGYYVIPCGSCRTVIQNVKAMLNEPQLHHIECFGIIDRDFRTDNEIASLAENHIFVLGVAEVENLFCTEEIMRIINHHLDKPDENAINASCAYIQEQFNSNKNEQIDSATLTELKYRINGARNKDKVTEVIASYEALSRNITEKFTHANSNDAILRVFNHKGLASSIGTNFGLLQGNAYKELVVALFRGKKHEEIKAALQPYMPAPENIPYEA